MYKPPSSTFDPSIHAPVPFWRDIRFIQIFLQIVFMVGVIVLGYTLIHNLVNNLADNRMAINFGAFDRPFGTAISEGVANFDPANTSNWSALAIGFKNTLRVVWVGLIGATVLGVLIGIGRLSSNFLARQVTIAYIEVFRNTPLLVQLYFIYRGLRMTMPERVQDSIRLPGPIFINRRAVNYPLIQGTDTAWIFWVLLGTGVALGIALWIRRLRRQDRTGEPANVMRYFLASTLLFGAAGWLLAAGPFQAELPVLKRFNFDGGAKLSAEYITLTVGLILYTAAFIADIVRAGIQAVPYGQIEAARAQGFSGSQTLRLIVLPQALRLIIPPLGNQYLNLAKNSSLGVAIGYFDVYNIASIITNQTGQAVAVFAIMMALYLSMSLTISVVMNAVNYSMRLRSR